VFFAAASTTNAVTEVASRYEKLGLGTVRTVYASSSTLARQIANGAPADILLSANQSWMDYLAEENKVSKGSQLDFLGNRLVLIVPASEQPSGASPPWDNLGAFLGPGRLAIGDPSHVPAGVYAKHALQKLGQWDALADRLVYAKDVRGALALVERGDAAAGIVYATDAKISRNVQEVDEVPGASNLNIAYPLAVVAERNRPEVTRFLDFLKGPEARRIFSDFGFTSLVKPPAPASATN